MFDILRKSKKKDTGRGEEDRMMDTLLAHSTGWVGIGNVQIGERRYPRTLVQQHTVRDCAGGNDVTLVHHNMDFNIWCCGACGVHLAFGQEPRAKAMAGGLSDDK